MLVDGGDLLQAAITSGSHEMVQFLIEKGARLDSPPEIVGKTLLDKK